MFSRVAVAALLALPLLAVADSNCNTGSLQCCDSVESSDSAAGSAIASLLGLDLQGATAMLGLNCSPLSVVGVGSGSSCSASPVCCENNNVGGLISVGCAPIEL